MNERLSPASSPKPSLSEIMQRTYPGWDTFSENQRGQMLVDWLKALLASEEGEPLRQALEANRTNREESGGSQNDYFKPTNYVTKADLLRNKPELADLIEQAPEEALVDYVADKVGDALEETYWLAMGIVLDDYFKQGSDETAKENQTP